METGAPLDTDVSIETPEHIVFRYRIAGPARRLLAYLLDLLICYGALAVLVLLVMLAALGAEAAFGKAEELPSAGTGLLLVVFFSIQWVYFGALEAWRGRTPGKAVLGLSVVTTDGRPVGVRGALLRNVLRAADALPLTYLAGLLSVAGLVSMSVTRRFQRLGDLAADTMVVVPERARAVAPLALWPPPQPAELAAIPEGVRLEHEERQAIEMFLRRRPRLGRARELELAAMIAPLLEARFGAPPSADPARCLALYYDRASGGAPAGGAAMPARGPEPRQ